MQARETLKHIIAADNISYTEIANKIGLKRQNMWDFINSTQRKDIMANRFVQIANLLGYKVMLVPQDADKPSVEVTDM